MWEPPFLALQSMVGLSYAMVLFLVAVGLTLIFGVARIVNFAHGSLYMLGAFLCYSLVSWLPKAPGNFWLALLLAPIIVAIVGGVMEVVFVRPTYPREHLDQLLLTYGLVLMVSESVRIIWGKAEKSVPTPDILAASVPILGLRFPSYRLFLIALGLLVALGLWLLLNRTRVGSMIRAAAWDREMASALGVNVPLLFTGVFVLGSWLAAIAGVVAAPLGAIWSGMDIATIIPAFMIVVVGGGGTIGGTLLAAVLVGLLDSFGILVLPRFAMLFVYVLMAVILIFRPWGLLGKPMR